MTLGALTLGPAIVALTVAPTVAPTPASVEGPPADPAPAHACAERPELTAAQRATEIDAAVARAVDAFAASKFAEALAALDTADCLERRPAHAYIRGAILKEQGECGAAIEHFDAFLAADVPPADAEAAAKLREQCRAQQPAIVGPVAPPNEPGPQPEATPSDDAPVRDDRPPPPCPPPNRPDALGIGLTTVGAAVLMAGVGMLVGAQVLKARAPDRADLAAHDRALRTARSLNPAGWVTAGVGAAGLSIGAIRLGRVRAARREARQRMPARCR